MRPKYWFDQPKVNIIKHKILLSHIKMGKDILTFGNIEIEERKIYCNKTPIFLKYVCIKKVLVSNKIIFGEENYKTWLVTCITIIKASHYI